MAFAMIDVGVTPIGVTTIGVATIGAVTTRRRTGSQRRVVPAAQVVRSVEADSEALSVGSAAAVASVAVGESFDEFFARTFRPLATLAAAIAGNTGEGEDAAQEALARASNRWTEVGRWEHRDLWVRRVAINLAISERRRVGRQADLLSRLRPDSSDGDLRVGGVSMSDLQFALAALTPAQRIAVMAVAVDGAAAVDIAAILGCSEATARVHLHRGRRRIREMLERLGSGHERVRTRPAPR